MNAALLVLLRLTWWAKLRRVARSLGTLRGAIFSLLGIAIFAVWLGPTLFLARHLPPAEPEVVVNYASSMTLLMCLMALLSSGGQAAAYFSPAEINFLFPGPFTRRALLAFKLGSTAGGWCLATVLFSVAFLPFVPWYPSACVGIFLLFLFVQLFAMLVALAGQTIAEHAFTRARRVLVFGVAVLVAGGLWKVLGEVKAFPDRHPADLFSLVGVLRASWGGYLLAPFDLFGWTIAAQTLRALVQWGGLALLVNLALVGLVFWLDARWEEATLLASQRAYERLDQMRRGGGLWALARPGRIRLHLPMLPRLGGAGTLAWRQVTAVARHPWTLIALMFFSFLMLAPGLLMGRSTVDPFLVLLAGMWYSMFLQCDFRGDVDHLSWLKMLPFRPVAVAAGELAAPALLTTVLQFLLFGGLALLTDRPWELLVAALFALPVNLVLFGAQNLVFLLFPARMMPATAGDLQHMGRLMLLLFLQFMSLLVLGAGAGLVGLAAAWLAGWSWMVGLAAAWGAVALEAGAFIPLVALAYTRFDVSLHTPP